VVLCLGAAMFAADVVVEFNVSLRAAGLVTPLITCVMLWRLFAWPWLAFRESLLATMKTRRVVPTGCPRIAYRVTDDLRIGRLVVRAAIEREAASGKRRIVHSPVPIPLAGTAPDTARPAVSGTFPFALGPLKLVKGDKVEVVLEATDHRGSVPGKVAASAPIELFVTDARGVESAVTELDPALERQFQTLIERQLEVGRSR
jgi:hypothetical protein